MNKDNGTKGISGAAGDSSTATGSNREQKEIAQWLDKLRFPKRILGGIKEEDVWEKIDRLNSMYQAALNAERIRYDALIEHYRKTNKEGVAKDT